MAQKSAVEWVSKRAKKLVVQTDVKKAGSMVFQRVDHSVYGMVVMMVDW